MSHQRQPHYHSSARQNNYPAQRGPPPYSHGTSLPPPSVSGNPQGNAGFSLPNFNIPPPNFVNAGRNPPPPAPYYRDRAGNSTGSGQYHQSINNPPYKHHGYSGGGSNYSSGRRYGESPHASSGSAGNSGYVHPSSSHRPSSSYARQSASKHHSMGSGRSHSVPANVDRSSRSRLDRSSSCRRESEDHGSSSGERRSTRHSRFKVDTERAEILSKWCRNYCETSEDIARKLVEMANDEDRTLWVRSSPAELYYKRVSDRVVQSTGRLDALCTLFDEELIRRAERIRATQPPYNPPPRKRKMKMCRHKHDKCSSSSESSDDEIEFEDECSMEELTAKIKHPLRLHVDLWYNDPGEMNDGPLCRCSARSRRTGIRHGKYPGEEGFPKCAPNSNNADKLHHYRITISPPTNFLTKTPTIIKHDQHEFLFEGFSLLAHEPIDELPTCKVIRFNIEYTILYIEEKMPENFTIRELDLFDRYLFRELLELVDFTVQPSGSTEDNSCPCYHFLPRFVRDLPDNGKEVLAMSEVLRYLLDNSGPLVPPDMLKEMMDMSQNEWQDYVDYVKGMVVTNPGMKPCSVRVDQLDRNVGDVPEATAVDENGLMHPVIVHFGIRPPQLSYAGNPEYQKAWREYIKFRHLVANMSKPSFEDKRKLEAKENRLLEMRMQGRMKRNITIAVSAKAFHRTGIMCDMVQHAMLIPVLTGHLRFHRALNVLEKYIGYTFTNRYTLQLALTHPSYKENFGTNPDHARNSLTNCGIRQPEYGDRKIHYMNTRKRGINTLISIMSRFGKENETDSNITHNERLEFLGDAVVEFITSIHLFHMFPDLEEGGLATYRAAIVQNQHLAVLAKKLHLEEFMLYAHGSDLCHELELRHALANCFEALMGALLLDGGIEVADRVFAYALFQEDESLRDIWVNYPRHPLQEQEPFGDRHHIESFEMLKTLTRFEESIGVSFNHIRLLARAFTDRSIGFTNLTLGSNQRLEFLGDTVLQLICSEYLYRHFPEHHEGHLSLLRSSLVNNRTQAVVCDDLGMTQYAVYSNPKADLKTKDRADLLEAFLGALYVDKKLEYCETFCHVCLFPRLQDFIMNQDWNDPKSKLQQCCLTLRTMDGGEPDIPVYKVIECTGPTNTRVYSVAVYFRGKRLACADGHSIQQAEMNAAKQALENSKDLFPQLDHQKRVIAQSLKRQKVPRSAAGLRMGASSTGGGAGDGMEPMEDDDDEQQGDRKLDSPSNGNRQDEEHRSDPAEEAAKRQRERKNASVFLPESARLPKQYQMNRSSRSSKSSVGSGSSSDASHSSDEGSVSLRKRKRNRHGSFGSSINSEEEDVKLDKPTDNTSLEDIKPSPLKERKSPTEQLEPPTADRKVETGPTGFEYSSLSEDDDLGLEDISDSDEHFGKSCSPDAIDTHDIKQEELEDSLENASVDQTVSVDVEAPVEAQTDKHAANEEIKVNTVKLEEADDVSSESVSIKLEGVDDISSDLEAGEID
ncbi:ribonuclease 3 [Anopheles ziemanni]|uniref:ribonuclease 3 n=1 Tax=Anopheles coustani TaxID=139045 RepID=UPI00265A7D69|nr:ribonuclease 3 [Anopheles coustani]XP_058177649.1 ribonuclease 3 [Anopheles ziemanni]